MGQGSWFPSVALARQAKKAEQLVSIIGPFGLPWTIEIEKGTLTPQQLGLNLSIPDPCWRRVKGSPRFCLLKKW